MSEPSGQRHPAPGGLFLSSSGGGNHDSRHPLPAGILALIVFVATLVIAPLVLWVADRIGNSPSGHGAGATVTPADPPAITDAAPPRHAHSALASMGFPTPRDNLFDPVVTNAYIPTNPNVPETALYGSARTGTDGFARFHKGIDIAPALPRTRKGEPTDPVVAVADGTVLYVNRVAGNSSYGIHVVLLHDDPVGSAYTLYAHLASVPAGLREGATVRQGEEIGVMGRTSGVTRIAPWNAHLHFEAGLLFSRNFAAWERETKQKPLRGNGHGWNLLAADPREVLRMATDRPGRFSMLDFVRSLPPACVITLHVQRLPDYFLVHPVLWHGAAVPPSGADITLSLTDSGLILSGRLATAEESAALAALPPKGERVAVVSAAEELLGRNGMRIVVRDGGRWRLGTNKTALRWVEILRR